MSERLAPGKMALIGVVALVGVLVASQERLGQIWRESQESGTGESRLAPGGGERGSREAATAAPGADPGPIVQTEEQSGAAQTISVADGIRLVRESLDGEFIGYRVIENETDPRFAAGDIITSVDGEPVEDSAAGSERLIALLVNADREVATRQP